MKRMPGANPASNMPIMRRRAMRCLYDCAAAMTQVAAPHKTMIVGKKMDGRDLAKIILEGTSKST